jgi:hypothetical protein
LNFISHFDVTGVRSPDDAGLIAAKAKSAHQALTLIINKIPY